MESWVIFAMGFGSGTLFGIVIVFIVHRQGEKQRKHHEDQLLELIKGNFSTLSASALTTSQDNFLKLAEQRLLTQTNQHTSELDSKKQLIDQQLEQMQSKLGQVEQLVSEFEKEREKKLGALGQQLEDLTRTSSLLQQALADNRSRGQWGERIAEDILKIAGLVEGVNYKKQSTTNSGSRPDFTFFLPNGLVLNMDSKFPLTNYLKFLEVEAESDKETYRKQFLKDVNDRVKEITKRGYINAEQNTVDVALVFIPNEQIYRFIHEQDDTIIDNALKNKIIVCSPLTLYIVLAIIQQAAQNFALEQSSRDILLLLNNIKKQWGMFKDRMTRLGDHLEKASEVYDDLLGTRKRQLDKQFQDLDDLLVQNDVSVIPENDSL